MRWSGGAQPSLLRRWWSSRRRSFVRLSARRRRVVSLAAPPRRAPTDRLGRRDRRVLPARPRATRATRRAGLMRPRDHLGRDPQGAAVRLHRHRHPPGNSRWYFARIFIAWIANSEPSARTIVTTSAMARSSGWLRPWATERSWCRRSTSSSAVPREQRPRAGHSPRRARGVPVQRPCRQTLDLRAGALQPGQDAVRPGHR